MNELKTKKLRSISLVDDQGAEPQENATKSPEPLTLKLLDDYVSKLVQFEKQSLVGQERAIQPAMLSSLSDLHAVGTSAFRFKKPDQDREKLAAIVASLLKKTEGS